MRSTESGQEVVQRGLIGQIDDREPRSPLVLVALKYVVVTQG